MKKLIFTLFIAVSGIAFGQQDKSISMWYQSPMMYNPGIGCNGG